MLIKTENLIMLTLKTESKLVEPLWETEWKFLKNLKIELTYPEILLLAIYPKKTKTLIQKDMYTLCSSQHNLQ